MSDSERLAAAQAALAEIERKYGVTIRIQSDVRRMDGGGVVITPQTLFVLIEGWQGEK